MKNFKSIGMSLGVVSLLGMVLVGCGGGSDDTSTDDATISENVSPTVDSGECSVATTSTDWSTLDYMTKEDMVDAVNKTVTNDKYEVSYFGEGDCTNSYVDITRVSFAKFDFTDNYQTANNVLSFAVNTNGDSQNSVLTVYLDTDNDKNTGVLITSASDSIGADKAFMIDYNDFLRFDRIDNYTNLPDRLRMKNEFEYVSSVGDLATGGWYAISIADVASNYFTGKDVRAIATVDLFDRSTGGTSVSYKDIYDITPVFTIKAF